MNRFVERFLVLILALIFMLSPVQTFADSGKCFSDVPAGFWAAEYINRAAQNGWIEGFDDGSFRPNSPVTYAQWLTMLGNLYYPEQMKRAQSGGYWYDKAVNATRDEGILASTVMLDLWGGSKVVHGNGADNTICRYEMARTIANLSHYMYEYRTKQLQSEGTSPISFTDIGYANIYGYTRYYYDNVRLCTSLGLLEGKGDGIFDGEAPVKRSEAAAVLCRLADTFISHPLRTDEFGNVIDPTANTDPNKTFFPAKPTIYGVYTGGKYGPENQFAAYTCPEGFSQEYWSSLLYGFASYRRDYCSYYLTHYDNGDGTGSIEFDWIRMLTDYVRSNISCLQVPASVEIFDWDFSYILDAYEHVGKKYGITQRSSDYDKVYAIHSYLACEYTYNYALMNNVVNCGDMSMPKLINYSIDKKSTICQGFAEVMEALCRMYGVECLALSSNDHAWNMVNVDGKWYHCDSCWDCCTNHEGTEYTYFLLSDSKISKYDHHHTWEADHMDILPSCPHSYAEHTGAAAKSPDVERTAAIENRQHLKSKDFEDILDEELRLINAERTKAGVSLLKPDDWLMFCADNDAKNRLDYSGYYRDTIMEPDEPCACYYEGPSGLCAENSYRGNGDVKEMLHNMLLSAKCREQLLDPNFTDIGLSIVSGKDLSGEEMYYWVQLFSGENASASLPADPRDLAFKIDTDKYDMSASLKAAIEKLKITYNVHYFTFVGMQNDDTILYEVRMKAGESIKTTESPFRIYSNTGYPETMVKVHLMEGYAASKNNSLIIAERTGDSYLNMGLKIDADGECSPEIAFVRLHIIVD